MPRMRLAMRGWNSSRASIFSPMPTKRMESAPVMRRTLMAAPPQVSESNLVRMIPSTSEALVEARAELTASWPVMASTTRKTWWAGGVLVDLVEFLHEGVVDVEAPAVSRMTVSMPRLRA